LLLFVTGAGYGDT